MAFFGLKLGLDFGMRAAHPHQKFQGVSPGAIANRKRANSGDEFHPFRSFPSVFVFFVGETEANERRLSLAVPR